MAQPANLHCFEEPHWMVIAKGMDTERWFQDGQAIGTGGIQAPREIDLPVGHRYYRFASSTSPRAAQLGSGWWLEFEAFKTIELFAKAQGYSLPDAARLFLAIPYAWSRMDRIVHATLEVPLRAYSGYGKLAQSGPVDPRDRGTRWIPLQHGRVRQLYIPGLYVHGSRPREQLYERAFRAPTLEFAHSRAPA